MASVTTAFSSYEDVVRVPLIVRAPGFRPARIGAVVRLVDLMPTVLDFYGMTAPRLDGVTLTGLMSGRQPDLGLEAYAESVDPRRFGRTTLRAMRDARFKVIEAPCPELYDLAADPFETTNLYQERRPLADAMRRRLQVISSERQAADPSTEPVPGVSPDLKTRLSALGYLGTQRPDTRGRDHLPDPKDCGHPTGGKKGS